MNATVAVTSDGQGLVLSATKPRGRERRLLRLMLMVPFPS